VEVIRFIFYMGVIQIVFSTLWKFIATLSSTLLESLGFNRDLTFLAFKAMGYYLLVSVAALVTWDEMVRGSTLGAALVAALGVFIMYTTIAGNLERNRWRAVMNFERKRIRVMRFDGYLLLGSMVLYLVTLALPEIASNPVTDSVRTLIDRVYHAPVIGWIVGLGACFYMLHIIYRGLKATDYLVQLLFYGGKGRSSAQPDDEVEGEYVDYVEVREEDNQR
jgi:hypothetical protein